MLKIAPSLLAADFRRLGREVIAVERAGADLIHIDVMDGHFVPNLSFGPMVVESLRGISELPFNAHLMVDEPRRFIAPFSDAGVDLITIHVEAHQGLYSTINSIKRLGRKAGIALSPPTPLCSIRHIMEDIDLILIMSVDPGYGGQVFIPSILPKISEARRMIDKRGLEIDLAVDGGVNVETAPLIAEAGASILVAGTAVFKESSVAKAIQDIRESIR